jgi:uncharacterized membrane protein
MLYIVIKWLHILSAITALGSNITYGFWMARASRTKENLVFTLKTIQALDRAIANRGYIALLITGLLMFFLGRWPVTTSWLDIALVLYGFVALLGFLAYAPTLRKQIQLAEMNGVDSSEYRATARRSNLLGIITIVIVAIIVLLMVTKPTFWG